MTGLLLVAGANCGGAQRHMATDCRPEFEPWIELVRSEVPVRHAAAVDVYKLVHQGLAGPGHAAPSREAARAWMTAEIAGLRNGYGLVVPIPDEPTVTPVSPDSGLVRVHLRPWLAGSGSVESLLDAFLRTADEVAPADPELASDFEGVAACLVRAAANGSLHHDASELRQVFDEARRGGYESVHHSARYDSVFRPAYRVVGRSHLSIVEPAPTNDVRGSADRIR